MTTPPAATANPDERAIDDGDETSGSAPVVTLGLVPSPGLPEEVARDIRGDLAEELSEIVDSSIDWVVRVTPDPLTGTDITSADLFGELVKVAKQASWDYTVALTDIPARSNKQIVLANASVDNHAAWISIPALGPFRLHRRTRLLTTELVRNFTLDRSDAASAEDIISSTIARRDTSAGRTDATETRYIAPGPLARLRLLGGMVYANQPWTTFASFKTTVATAVATASYGLIFTSLWEFGSVYSIWRLISLMLLAMGFLGTWIIISHRLWQPQWRVTARFVTSMYNATTVVTVACGVVFAYVLIYVILLIEAAVFMPPSLLESRLQLTPDVLTYAKAAWVAASVGTLAGAIGVGLENTEAVRRATFGWRQHRRHEEYLEQTREERDSDRQDSTDDP
jgi:hypothetical protein